MTNTPQRQPSDDREKQAALSVTDCLEQLAIALKAVIPGPRQALYLRALSDLMIPQIEYGFDQALKHFIPGYGMDFPAPAMLRDWCLQWKDNGVPEALTRQLKPPGWQPITPAELAELNRAVQERAKQAAMPSYNATAEALAAARNVTTTVPADPAERASWAKAKAADQGWNTAPIPGPDPGEDF